MYPEETRETQFLLIDELLLHPYRESLSFPPPLFPLFKIESTTTIT